MLKEGRVLYELSSRAQAETAGQINGTTSSDHNLTRVGVGTGVYSLGASRQIEFGLPITF